MSWIYAKLAGMGGKILALLGAIGGVALVWMRGSYQKKRADQAERNTEAATAQAEQVNRAVEAARVATVDGQEKVHENVEKAKRGDYSGLND